ncbi:ABC transporter, ATP-binding protein [Dictyocaulus viviparus]|uniref:ABC transporter, ATP-binding protein n=1 Tax=Dictyocaulus viviparus TaxID=29172 RepID=A0A0D8XUG7_DICVI|nr:ABC transporter, ATP-binding protein [Dictyocaulus viviparus]
MSLLCEVLKKPISQCMMVNSTLLSFYENVDSFVRCRYLTPATARWLALRLELLGNIMVFICSVMVSLFHAMNLITAGQVGLCVSYALSLTDLMNFSVRMLALSEANIVAVERVKEYHDIEREGPYTSDYPLLSTWPHNGTIEFRNFSIRYGDNEKFAVKNMTLLIKGGEKLAIVGRTGSVEKTTGDVFIDGVNISELGLNELRTRITIIPQDPVLFSSTLRFNIDPFNRFTDSDIWLALEACQLKEMVSKHKDGLMTEIEEGGKNMSIGERQLVCLCRSLLEGGAIVILDEVSAALDHSAQALVNDVIRMHFRDATVITIAHKLETIGDYDRIVVVDDGEVIEFDTPHNLLARDNSVYREMVESSKKSL